MSSMLEKIYKRFGEDGEITSSGVTYPCPFHKGTETGSFYVCPEKGIYNCFSCGAKGSILNKKEINDLKLTKTTTKTTENKEFISYKPNKYGSKKLIEYLETREIWYDFNEFDFQDKLACITDNSGYKLVLIVDDKSNYVYYLNDYNQKKNKGWKKNSKITNIFNFKHESFEKTENIFVFEGFEDCLAYIEMYNYFIDFTNSVFCILFGVYNIKKLNFNLKNVNYFLCVDNDKAGLEMSLKAPKQKNIYTLNPIDKEVKDYNELLVKHKNFFDRNDRKIEEFGETTELLNQRLTLTYERVN